MSFYQIAHPLSKNFTCWLSHFHDKNYMRNHKNVQKKWVRFDFRLCSSVAFGQN